MNYRPAALIEHKDLPIRGIPADCLRHKTRFRADDLGRLFLRFDGWTEAHYLCVSEDGQALESLGVYAVNSELVGWRWDANDAGPKDTMLDQLRAALRACGKGVTYPPAEAPA